MDSVLHPLILWAERKDKLFITIALEDCQEPKIELTETNLTFRSKGGHDQKQYAVELEFNQEVIPKDSKQLVTSREITFNIKKKDEGYWPRLLKDEKKPPYLKTDFQKWRDEDDSDVEDNYTPDDANFEDMVNSMGGMEAGEKFDPGEADSDDSDDEELPDLEEEVKEAQ